MRPDGPRRAVLPACADRQRHRPRRVLHGRRLDDAGPGAPGAADAAEPSGARGAEPLHWRAAPAGGRRRPPPPGQFLAGSRRHIHRHYDLGNEFFRLFLDTDLLMYSCGYFESAADTLEQAQSRKVDRICRALKLQPTDHVLEIGSGWGGFAVWAATRYGCRVTTTTISDEQYRHVCEWRSRIGEAGARIEVLRADYRELTGRFDKVVSIEMFEAVGLSHYDEYFTAVDRLLAPDGVMFLQTITVDDQWFPKYHGTPDWIEKYIFPGGELASVGEMLKSLARTTSLSLYHAENCGTHYAHTLRAWRARFHHNLARVRALGFDDRFIRMWDLYLGSCEATFLERHTGLFQLVLVKNGAQRVLFNEPWAGTSHRDSRLWSNAEEMLRLGVFRREVLDGLPGGFPRSWFARARLCAQRA